MAVDVISILFDRAADNFAATETVVQPTKRTGFAQISLLEHGLKPAHDAFLERFGFEPDELKFEEFGEGHKTRTLPERHVMRRQVEWQ